MYIYIYVYIYIVFADNTPERPGFNLSSSHTKESKMVLDVLWLTLI